MFKVIEPEENQRAKELWPNDMCNCSLEFYSCHARWVMHCSDDDKDDLEEVVKFIEQYNVQTRS